MTRALMIAALLCASPALAQPSPRYLPQDEVEKLLTMSADYAARGYEDAAQAVYDAATECEFCSDDHPEDDGETARALFGRERMRVIGRALCGPKGVIDWTGAGPTCERSGWNSRSYVKPCEKTRYYVCERERR